METCDIKFQSCMPQTTSSMLEPLMSVMEAPGAPVHSAPDQANYSEQPIASAPDRSSSKGPDGTTRLFTPPELLYSPDYSDANVAAEVAEHHLARAASERLLGREEEAETALENARRAVALSGLEEVSHSGVHYNLLRYWNETAQSIDPDNDRLREDVGEVLQEETIQAIQRIEAWVERLKAQRNEGLGSGETRAKLQSEFIADLRRSVQSGEATTLDEAIAIARVKQSHRLRNISGHQGRNLRSRDAHFELILEMESEAGLKKLSTTNDQQRLDYLFSVAEKLNESRGSYDGSAEIYKSIFSEHIVRVMNSLEPETLNALIEEAEGDPGVFQQRLNKLVYQQLAEEFDDQTSSLSADAPARKAWEKFEDMMDPNDEFWNISSAGWDRIRDEAFITLQTLPIGMGIGTVVSRGLSGMRCATQIAKEGTRLQRVAAGTGIYGTRAITEGFAIARMNAQLLGRDFHWEDGLHMAAMSAIFHGANLTWARGADRLGVNAVLADSTASTTARVTARSIDVAGQVLTPSAMVLPATYGLDYVIGAENPNTTAEQFGANMMYQGAFLVLGRFMPRPIVQESATRDVSSAREMPPLVRWTQPYAFHNFKTRLRYKAGQWQSRAQEWLWPDSGVGPGPQLAFATGGAPRPVRSPLRPGIDVVYMSKKKNGGGKKKSDVDPQAKLDQHLTEHNSEFVMAAKSGNGEITVLVDNSQPLNRKPLNQLLRHDVLQDAGINTLKISVDGSPLAIPEKLHLGRLAQESGIRVELQGDPSRPPIEMQQSSTETVIEFLLEASRDIPATKRLKQMRAHLSDSALPKDVKSSILQRVVSDQVIGAIKQNTGSQPSAQTVAAIEHWVEAGHKDAKTRFESARQQRYPKEDVMNQVRDFQEGLLNKKDSWSQAVDHMLTWIEAHPKKVQQLHDLFSNMARDPVETAAFAQNSFALAKEIAHYPAQIERTIDTLNNLYKAADQHKTHLHGAVFALRFGRSNGTSAEMASLTNWVQTKGVVAVEALPTDRHLQNSTPDLRVTFDQDGQRREVLVEVKNCGRDALALSDARSIEAQIKNGLAGRKKDYDQEGRALPFGVQIGHGIRQLLNTKIKTNSPLIILDVDLRGRRLNPATVSKISQILKDIEHKTGKTVRIRLLDNIQVIDTIAPSHQSWIDQVI